MASAAARALASRSLGDLAHVTTAHSDLACENDDPLLTLLYRHHQFPNISRPRSVVNSSGIESVLSPGQPKNRKLPVPFNSGYEVVAVLSNKPGSVDGPNRGSCAVRRSYNALDPENVQLWRVSRVSSAIVFVISSIGPLADYIPKRFAGIVIGIIIDRRHLPLLLLSTQLHMAHPLIYTILCSRFLQCRLRVSRKVGLVNRNRINRYQMPFAGFLAYILPPLFSYPLANWLLLNIKITVCLSEIWLPISLQFPSSPYSRIKSPCQYMRIFLSTSSNTSISYRVFHHHTHCVPLFEFLCIMSKGLLFAVFAESLIGILVRRMAKLTDDADFDGGGTFENVSSPLSDAGNHDNYFGRRLQTRCVLHSCDNEVNPLLISCSSGFYGKGYAGVLYPCADCPSRLSDAFLITVIAVSAVNSGALHFVDFFMLVRQAGEEGYPFLQDYANVPFP
ncbi:unnamed protein product [Protopolystoma xenopodis]|uniref:Uncharacterized protein n=1 Tax=Protopolystoma xenopodis TaxID=117903 RepID=A0A448XII3_9PLAT|nr:unnamed protein product [Protopolystoma xenopodis]